MKQLPPLTDEEALILNNALSAYLNCRILDERDASPGMRLQQKLAEGTVDLSEGIHRGVYLDMYPIDGGAVVTSGPHEDVIIQSYTCSIDGRVVAYRERQMWQTHGDTDALPHDTRLYQLRIRPALPTDGREGRVMRALERLEGAAAGLEGSLDLHLCTDCDAEIFHEKLELTQERITAQTVLGGE